MSIWSLYGWQWRGWAALLLLAATLFFAVVLFPAASRRSGSSSNRIVDLQRAYTPEMFGGVLQAWSTSNPEAVGIMKRENILKLDLIFPALYALTFSLLYAFLSGRRQPTALDFVLFVTPFVAAAFDYIEDGIHLRLLAGVDNADDVDMAVTAGRFPASLVFAASAFAHAKYILLIVSTVGLVTVIVERLRARL